MKIEINKLILSFLLFLPGCYSGRNDDVSFKKESQCLLSKKYELLLPIPFHVQKDNYEEGVCFFYSFTDSSYIIVFEGALMQFSVDRYSPAGRKTFGDKKISYGKKEDNFWRKDILDGVIVCYDNVYAKQKKVFDKILDNIKLESLGHSTSKKESRGRHSE